MYNLVHIDDIDTSSLLNEVINNEVLFDTIPVRTLSENSPHREVSDILLRGPEFKETSTTYDLFNEIQCVNYKETLEKFPLIYEHVLDLMRLESGTQLGRVIITKLSCGGRIYEHADEGEAGDFYTRYHTILEGLAGNTFSSGGETVDMLTGSVWKINNHINHSALNSSVSTRVHLICDIRL